jgi:hypothetical protein
VGGEVTTDAAKHLFSVHRAETARHLLLDLDHPESVVSLVVGEIHEGASMNLRVASSNLLSLSRSFLDYDLAILPGVIEVKQTCRSKSIFDPVVEKP